MAIINFLLLDSLLFWGEAVTRKLEYFYVIFVNNLVKLIVKCPFIIRGIFLLRKIRSFTTKVSKNNKKFF